MKLSPGDKAPPFSMTTSERKAVSDETLRGKKLLLLFFPAAFTSTCTRELCSVRDDIARYNELNVEVIGISTDSVYVLAKYKEEQKLNFTLASDYNKDVSEAFGALYEVFNFGMKGVSKRAAFVIDENGVVQYAEVLENAGEVPDFNAINNIISSMS